MAHQPKVVFRIEKLKSWGEIGAAAGHNLRQRPTPNAGEGGFVEVVPLTSPAADAARAKIGDQTIRKNAVLGVEIVISASPEYFRPDAPQRAGFWEKEKLDAWREKMEPWIAEKFPHAISVVLHLDEATPHYQIIDIPLDEKGKLNCRGKYGGKENLIAWQDAAAEPVAALGIERGIAGSLAKHERVKAFYEAVNAPVPHIPSVPTPVPKPLPPRGMSESVPLTKAKEERDALEEQNAAQRAKREAEKRAQQKAINTAWPAVTQKANAVDLAQQKQREAEATAAKLSRLKKDADQLRELPLDQVLKRVYGAELEKESRPTHASRKYVLADGRKIAVSKGNAGADVWIEQGGKGQRGAINLVMHLDGYKYPDAVRLLAEHFDSTAVSTEHARELVKRAVADVRELKKEPVAAPAPDPSKWPRVKKWLTEIRGMPSKLVDKLHSLGLVYADSRANATFKRENGGAFQRGTGSVKFHRSVGGPECGPFIVPGPSGRSNKIVLVEAPLDAIAAVATHLGAMAIASGGDQLPPAKLAPWIPDGAEVLAGHDNDKRGDQVAKEAAKEFNATRSKPSHKDWSETVQKEPWRIKSPWNEGSSADPAKMAPRADLGPS